MKLKDIKGQIGAKFKFVHIDHGNVFMTLSLCPGMIRQGNAVGGKETVAVAVIECNHPSGKHPGHTFYFHDSYDIELVP